MAKKPFTMINERLGEILEILRALSGKNPPRQANGTMLAAVAENASPAAKRWYVVVPDGTGVGDVVAHDGGIGVKGIPALGIVTDLIDPDTVFDCRNPGRAYAVWKGPMIRYGIKKGE